MQPMQITESCKNDVAIFKLEGRLDNQGSDIFREHLLERIGKGALKVIIDFSGTSYIASLGIRALFIPARELAERRGKLVLCGLRPEVKSIFSIGGVLDLFPAYETVEEALKKSRW